MLHSFKKYRRSYKNILIEGQFLHLNIGIILLLVLINKFNDISILTILFSTLYILFSFFLSYVYSQLKKEKRNDLILSNLLDENEIFDLKYTVKDLEDVTLHLRTLDRNTSAEFKNDLWILIHKFKKNNNFKSALNN